MTQIHAETMTLMLTKRLRRLRTSPTLRAAVQETRLSPDVMMMPLFVCEGEGVRRWRAMEASVHARRRWR